MINYNGLSDKELVKLAQQNDRLAEEYLLKRYEALAYYLSKGYFSKGAEHEDFLQMSLIGLYKAIRSYKCNQEGTSFRNFATLCIKSELFDYLRSCTRNKHQILNNSIPFLSYNTNKNSEGKEKNNFADLVLKDTVNDPQNIILKKEILSTLEYMIKNILTKLEKEVLVLWIQNYSYKEISIIIGKNTKSVENSIQRIKNKLRREIIKVSA